MRHSKLLTLILLFTVIVPMLSQAERDKITDVRKTVDGSGKVIFSNSGFSNKKPSKKSTEEVVKVPPKSTAPKVDLYYASWDPYSNKAIMFFRENHIVVNAYDIDVDPEAAARKKRIDPNFIGLPLVIINGITIRGVDEKKYRDALATKPSQ